MGLIKAFTGAVGGGLGDVWLEVIESDKMTNSTLLCKGVKVRANDPRNSNLKGTEDAISNGTVIHVGEKQCMLLVDGGKIVDYTAEPGYYEVQNSSMPSMFNGQFGPALKETFQRFKYSGVTPYKQEVFFVNLQEIKGIKFGTRNPVSYYDNFYKAHLSLRAHGSYSIVVTNPLLFYADQVGRSETTVDISDINSQYMEEFLEAFTAALNKLSMEGISANYVNTEGPKLSRYMRDVLDEDWGENRGIEIKSVGIGSISMDEKSLALIDKINMGTAFSDPATREAYLQTTYVEGLSKGIENAGSNSAGSAQAFMGLGLGMNAANGAMGGGIGSFSETNRQQMKDEADRKAKAEEAKKSEDEEGKEASKDIKSEENLQASDRSWECPECHSENLGKFCSNCGTKKPEVDKKVCSNCGYEVPEGQSPKFCPECGNKF